MRAGSSSMGCCGPLCSCLFEFVRFWALLLVLGLSGACFVGVFQPQPDLNRSLRHPLPLTWHLTGAPYNPRCLPLGGRKNHIFWPHPTPWSKLARACGPQELDFKLARAPSACQTPSAPDSLVDGTLPMGIIGQHLGVETRPSRPKSCWSLA